MNECACSIKSTCRLISEAIKPCRTGYILNKARAIESYQQIELFLLRCFSCGTIHRFPSFELQLLTLLHGCDNDNINTIRSYIIRIQNGTYANKIIIHGPTRTTNDSLSRCCRRIMMSAHVQHHVFTLFI